MYYRLPELNLLLVQSLLRVTKTYFLNYGFDYIIFIFGLQKYINIMINPLECFSASKAKQHYLEIWDWDRIPYSSD